MEDFEVKLTRAEYDQLVALNEAAIEYFDQSGEAAQKLRSYASFLCAGAGRTIEAGQPWSFSKLKGGRYVLSVPASNPIEAALPF